MAEQIYCHYSCLYSVHYMPQTCFKMPTPLICCTVINALVSATVPRHRRTSVC